jgi:hypothetical protein
VLAAAAGGASPAAASADAVQDAAQALGAGCGDRAASIIAAEGLAADLAALGDVIYDGGAIATDSGNGARFVYAVPYAFLRGGVDAAIATEAFSRGVQDFAGGAPTTPTGVLFYRGSIGAQTVANTYVAYLEGLTRVVSAARRTLRIGLRDDRFQPDLALRAGCRGGRSRPRRIDRLRVADLRRVPGPDAGLRPL